jgi:hypothetical protein
MLQSPRSRTTVLSLIVMCAIAFAVMATNAMAAGSFGELTRFGEGGSGTQTGTLREPFEALSGQFTGTRAIGVDPTDNSVYVVDEPTEPSQEKSEVAPDLEENAETCPPGYTEVLGPDEEPINCYELHGPVERHFRLQKFKANSSGVYEAVASTEFSEKLPVFEQEPFEDPSALRSEQTIEGIAVDPSRERVYLLSVDERRKAPDAIRAKFSQFPQTPEAEAHELEASQLYAFSTKESGSKLQPEGKSGTPVLTGRSEIGAESSAAGAALLEPAGITVAPASGDVIVLAHIDTKGEAKDQVHNAWDHYVLQQITPAGALGERYVDETNVLKEHFTPLSVKPNSPIVVPAPSGERVLVSDEELVEIPSPFSKEQAARSFAPYPNEDGVAHPVRNSEVGGLLSVSPDGKTIDVTAKVVKESKAEEELWGAMELSAETGAEIGWTGGQETKGGGKVECALEPYNANLLTPTPQIAAANGGKLFVLSTEFLLREEPNGEPIEGPFHPAVVEFGPEGKGCATAAISSEGVVAEVGGVKIADKGVVSPTKNVLLKSKLKQADALSVEWTLHNKTNGETTHEVVNTDELQVPELVHIFNEGGEFTISQVIHTDDLETPEVSFPGKGGQEYELHVEGATITEQPKNAETSEGNTATFKATASGSPSEVKWEISTDGGKEFLPDTTDSGHTTGTLSVKATPTENGYEYRAVFSEEGFTSTSHAATLSVSNGPKAPEITKQPENKTVLEGENVTLEAAASGSPVPTVQWAVSTGGGAFKEIPGKTETSLTIENVTGAESGNRYEATFKNSQGAATTQPATLTVSPPQPPQVTKNPASATVTEGQTAILEAAATGVPEPSIQWEVSTAGGAFKAVSNSGTIAGATAEKLELKNTTISENGNKYRATFTNKAGSRASTEATLTVNAKSAGNPPSNPPSNNNNGGGGGGGGSSESPGSGVLPSKEVGPTPVPAAAIAGTSISVTPAGALVLKVSCPAGETSCIGTVTLRTITAVKASSKGKKAILTLASGSFSVVGGQVKSITLHLSSTARRLLASSHSLKVKATVSAHDPAGASHSQLSTLTLRLVVPKTHKH